jgi:hypothetical protein
MAAFVAAARACVSHKNKLLWCQNIARFVPASHRAANGRVGPAKSESRRLVRPSIYIYENEKSKCCCVVYILYHSPS